MKRILIVGCTIAFMIFGFACLLAGPLPGFTLSLFIAVMQ